MTDPDEARRAELVALVRADYDATRSLIDGVVRTSIALRGIGMTLTLALLGYAVAHSSLALGLLGLASTWLFLYLDAFHGWLYDEGRRRARSVEHMLRLRYQQLERGNEDPDAGGDLDRALAAHRFGQYLALPRFRLRFLHQARPRAVYVLVYGSLTGLAVAAAIYGALT
jgi:hypothetical protein